MGAHLRNGRDISAEQRARQLELQQNFTVSPAAEERLRRIREQSASAARHREKFTLARTTGFGPGSIAERRQSAGGFFSPSLEYVDPRAGSNRQIRYDLTPSGSLGVEPIPIRPENSGIPPLVPIPSENRQENSAVPMEGVVSTRQYDLTKAMLDQQWALFIVAQEARDFNLMRMVLNQAITSQDLLTNLVGREEMLRVSENWVARDELAHLDRSTSDNSDNRTQIPVPNQADPPVVPTNSHPSVNPNHAAFYHHNSRPAIPANRPQRELRPTPEIQYLGRTHSATRERLPPPPPPSNPPPTTLQVYQTQPVALRPTMAPQTYADPPPQPHYGYQEYQYQEEGIEAQGGGKPILPREWSGWASLSTASRESWPVRPGYVVEKGANETSLIPNIRIRVIPNKLPLGRHHIPSINSFSDPSLKEDFFNNLNSQFVPDTTFLIEDRLKDLFKDFLSKLSSTFHSFPDPVLHSCVTEFKSTMHKSVNEMIMTEIVPTLISEVQNHLKNDVTKEVTSMDIKNEIEPLKEFVKEHVETVQDILHVNDSQMQANIEQVRHDLKEITQKQESQYTSLMEHLSTISEQENIRFEQIKRRLGDVGQTMSNLQNKINPSVVQEPREQPPHLHYNNPFLNQPHIPPPVQQMNTPTVVEPSHTNPVNTVVPDKKKLIGNYCTLL
ncbi:hypothetical protein KEM48_010372 [Puccinia striiformis f. sp. tritici PST-130]|nr:hypothetical protein KEM48_010372 [Puccinia striiformis f. sp. tritici PST-130]